MVLAELVEWVLRQLTTQFGVNGLAVGALAVAVVGLWYLHEVASVLAFASRYAQTAAVVGAVVLVVLVAGMATGAVDLSADGSVIGRFVGLAADWFNL